MQYDPLTGCTAQLDLLWMFTIKLEALYGTTATGSVVVVVVVVDAVDLVVVMVVVVVMLGGTDVTSSETPP